jgi:hypothetical protein
VGRRRDRNVPDDRGVGCVDVYDLDLRIHRGSRPEQEYPSAFTALAFGA